MSFKNFMKKSFSILREATSEFLEHPTQRQLFERRFIEMAIKHGVDFDNNEEVPIKNIKRMLNSYSIKPSKIDRLWPTQQVLTYPQFEEGMLKLESYFVV